MIPYCILVIEDDNDREFMTSLYINYKSLMYSTIYKIVKRADDSEDLMQDVLEKLIDKISLLRSRTRDQLANYIISACKFTALNHVRDKGNRPETPFEDCLEFPDNMTNSGSATDFTYKYDFSNLVSSGTEIQWVVRYRRSTPTSYMWAPAKYYNPSSDPNGSTNKWGYVTSTVRY